MSRANTSETDAKEFANNLVKTGMFQEAPAGGLKKLAAPDIFGLVTVAGVGVVLDLLKKALDAIDKVVDIVNKASGRVIPEMTVKCPQGTECVIKGATKKRALELMREFLETCRQKSLKSQPAVGHPHA